MSKEILAEIVNEQQNEIYADAIEKLQKELEALKEIYDSLYEDYIELKRGLLAQCLESLTWMITDLTHRFDADRQGEGGYSPELTKAIELQKELEERLK